MLAQNKSADTLPSEGTCHQENVGKRTGVTSWPSAHITRPGGCLQVTQTELVLRGLMFVVHD
eukprot:6277791-Pyramimonas_sp.AAC.1